jgi:hypothetical protein
MNHIEHRRYLAGAYLIRKAHANASQSGFLAAAKNLRKQGYPLFLALYILTGRIA